MGSPIGPARRQATTISLPARELLQANSDQAIFFLCLVWISLIVQIHINLSACARCLGPLCPQNSRVRRRWISFCAVQVLPVVPEQNLRIQVDIHLLCTCVCWSVFTVAQKPVWNDTASVDPHRIVLVSSLDNKRESADLPLAPWYVLWVDSAGCRDPLIILKTCEDWC